MTSWLPPPTHTPTTTASAAGQPRTLHIREGLAAIDWTLPPPQLHTPPDLPDLWQTCSDTPYFSLQTARLTRPCLLHTGGRSFHALFVAEGSCEVAADGGVERLETGASCLIPACVPAYAVTPLGGETRLLKTDAWHVATKPISRAGV